MTKTKLALFPFCVVALSAFLAGDPAAAEKADRIERFKDQAVMITVTHRDQSVDHGSGIVLCQEHGRVYVLTAFELLAGKTPRGRQVLRRPARTEIRFFDDSVPSFVDDRTEATPAGPRRGVTLYRHGEFHGPNETFYEDDPDLRDNLIGNDTVSSLRVDPGCQVELFEHIDYRGRSTSLSYKKARLWGTEVGRDNISSLKVSCRDMDERGLTYHQVPEDGLVLLTFPFQPLRWTAATRRGRVESWGSTSIFTSEQPMVSAVGYQSSSGESWVHQSGRLAPGGGNLLHHTIPIDAGFLGGPLFNKRSLIGINLRQVRSGAVYGEALSVRRILPALGKWLPERCRFWIGNRVDLFLPPATEPAAIPAVADLPPPEPTGHRHGEPTAAPADPPPEQLSTEQLSPEKRAHLSRSFQLAVAEQYDLDMSDDPQRLDEQTVMISVNRGGSMDHGAGVVLCEEDRQAYVLTAHHVLAGKQRTPSPGLTEIQFYHQSTPSVVSGPADGAVMEVHSLPEADLALLKIPVLGEPEARPSRVRPSAWARASAQGEPDVLAVGYRKLPLESWALEAGKLLPAAGDQLHHSAAIVEGFSGGPLFHGSGALIGINLERVAGAAIGAETDAFYGHALPMEEVLPLIRPWLPKTCLRDLETAMENAAPAIEAAAFLAVADKMKRVGSEREFGFGPYRITDVHGGAVRHQLLSRTKAKRKYRFSVESPGGRVSSGGRVWQGKCTEDIQVEEKGSKFLNFMLDQVFDESLAEAVNTSLSCTFDHPGGERITGLTLEERDAFSDVRGTGTVDGVQIEVAGTRSSVNYLLHVGGRLVGAVRKSDGSEFWFSTGSLSTGYGEDEGETFWLDPSVSADVRSACVAAAGALLLHSRFE